jgi:hypothetical protein
MTQRRVIHGQSQLQLFDQAPPSVALPPAQKIQLSALLESLFLDIADSLVTKEAGDEQDRR